MSVVDCYKKCRHKTKCVGAEYDDGQIMSYSVWNNITLVTSQAGSGDIFLLAVGGGVGLII
jgi:hypothetical protein